MSYCMNMWSRLWPPEPDPSRLSPPGFQKETSHCRKITHCFHIRLHHDQAWHPSGMLAPTLGQVDSYSYPGYPGAWGGHLHGLQGRDGPPGPNQRQDTTMASYSQPYGMGMGPTYTTHPEMPAGMRAQPEGPPEGISPPEGAGGEWQHQRRRVSHAQQPQGPHANPILFNMEFMKQAKSKAYHVSPREIFLQTHLPPPIHVLEYTL